MLVSGVIIGLLQYVQSLEPEAVRHLARWSRYIFFPESLAVSAFAFAWLIKGQIILKDGLFETSIAKQREIMKLIGMIMLPTGLFLLGWYLTWLG